MPELAIMLGFGWICVFRRVVGWSFCVLNILSRLYAIQMLGKWGEGERSKERNAFYAVVLCKE